MIPSRLRVHIGSFFWSATEGLMYPLLMVVATPVFLRTVGTEAFGQWLLVNSVIALGGLVGFGTVEATTKFVAEFRGNGDMTSVLCIARHNLFIGTVGSSAMGLLLCAFSPWLAAHLFAAMGDARSVAAALSVGAAMLVIQQVSGIIAAVIRGYEQFRTAARIEFAVRFASVSVALVMAWHTADIALALYCCAAVNVAGIAWRSVVARRLLGHGLWPPTWQARLAGESWRYAGWNWLNALVASLFASLDRLLIGSFLGAAALAHYGIALQLASFVLVLPSAGLAFLVPVMSRKSREAGNAQRATRLAILANIAVTVAVFLGLMLLGKLILTAWVGAATAQSVTGIYFWLLGAFTISSLAAAPQYLLLARGEARYCSNIFLAGASVGTIATFALIPSFGLLGAAWARYVHSATSLALYRRI
jgi:O-antigen/teichoic acid export membrane protein